MPKLDTSDRDTHHTYTYGTRQCTMARSRTRSRRVRQQPGLVSVSALPTPRVGLTVLQVVDPNLVVPRRSKREHEALLSCRQYPYNRGTWSDQERLLFLKGMRVYGLGRWKEIGTILTTRYAESR
jgi:hypothetical protein